MRIIIAQFNDGKIGAYSSVRAFLKAHPGKNYHTIMSRISRKNEPYADETVILTRIEVNSEAIKQRWITDDLPNQ